MWSKSYSETIPSICNSREGGSSHELVWPGSGCGINNSWVWPKPFMGVAKNSSWVM